MLKIPAIEQIGDVTVYADDVEWNRFYLVPKLPTLRRDAQGRPVFLLSLMRFSDQGRAENPDLPRGSGYLNFDVQLAVDDAQTEVARQRLQERVDEEHARRGGRGPAPKVQLTPPLISDGTVRLQLELPEELGHVGLAEVPASTVAGSAAVFNVTLTEEGANFMAGLFVTEGGEGNIDLSPLQIIYDLRMWARLPPVAITITAKSERVHETLLETSRSNRDDPCTPREIETFRENGLRSSTLAETADIDIHIDNGNAQLPPETLAELQQFALDMFDTMIEERFLEPAEADAGEIDFEDELEPGTPGSVATLYAGPNFTGEPQEVDGSLSLGSAFRARSVRVRAGHRVKLYTGANHTGASRIVSRSTASLDHRVRSVTVTAPPTTRYRVVRTVNHAEMDLRLELERSDTIEWPTGGQATLQTAFAGMSDAEIRRHVVEVTEDRFETLAVDVRGIADFENTAVAAIEVQLQYVAGDHAFDAAFTFDRNNVGVERFDPAIIDDVREYRFRHKIIYDDGVQTDYTPWERTRRRDLNIPAIDPGRIALDVSGASLNWDIVTSVLVELRYAHPAGDVEPVERSLELNALAPVAAWEHRMNQPLAGDMEARITYRMADDKVFEAEPTRISATENLLVVPPPQVDTLDVTLVPSGDFTDVVQVVAALRYDAGDGTVYDQTFRFTSADEIATWQVLLRDGARRSYTYEYVVTYRSGESKQFPQAVRDGDGALLLEVPSEPRLSVTLLPALLDFVETPAVSVAIEYAGQRQTFALTEQTPQHVFRAPLAGSGSRTWTYEITWHTADGRAIESGVRRSSDGHLLVPRPDRPRPGTLNVLVRGFAVDYAVTPFVDVRLRWTDGEREEEALVTLSEGNDSGAWSIELEDRSQRRYHYEVVYGLADGSRVPGPSGHTDDPVVSITPYQP